MNSSWLIAVNITSVEVLGYTLSYSNSKYIEKTINILINKKHLLPENCIKIHYLLQIMPCIRATRCPFNELTVHEPSINLKSTTHHQINSISKVLFTTKGCPQKIDESFLDSSKFYINLVFLQEFWRSLLISLEIASKDRKLWNVTVSSLFY